MNFIKMIAYVQFLIALGIVLGFYLGNPKYWVPFDLIIIVVLIVCGTVLLKQKPTSDIEINNE